MGAKPRWMLWKDLIRKQSFCIRYEEENFKRWQKEHKTLGFLTSFTSVWALNSSTNSSTSVDHIALRYIYSKQWELNQQTYTQRTVFGTIPNNWWENSRCFMMLKKSSWMKLCHKSQLDCITHTLAVNDFLLFCFTALGYSKPGVLKVAPVTEMIFMYHLHLCWIKSIYCYPSRTWWKYHKRPQGKALCALTPQSLNYDLV